MMTMLFYLSLIMVLAFARGDRMVEDESSGKDETAEENTANETFGVPGYSASNAIPFPALPLNGKSAYSYPISPSFSSASLPAVYKTYLRKLGLSNSNFYGMFNRYRYLPYSSPALYRPPLQSAVGYDSSLLSEFGYSGYNSPYFSRSTYPKVGYNYPGYRVGLGYGYSSLPPASLKVGLVARAVSPVAGVSTPITSLPAPVLPASSYKAAQRLLLRKDGSLRYIYAPNFQAFPTY